MKTPLDIVVIGAGQAGLATGYYLKKRNAHFAIVDGADRIGDSWRKRWDSLRLFTPARFDGLPGLPFPAPANSYPTKDDLADYLEAYARRFRLPVRLRTRVERLSRRGSLYALHTNDGVIEANQVVIAMGPCQSPHIPSFGDELANDIRQIHSSAYRNPESLAKGPVLVVGAGNSGAEIALDLARAGREVVLAGRDVGHVPFANDGLAARLLLNWLVLRVLFHRVLTIATPMGRRAKRNVHGKGVLLVRAKPHHLEKAGIRRVGRVARIENGLPVLDSGEHLPVANVVWATGYRQGFSWIDVPVLDDAGEPRHHAGVTSERGLFFVGLEFLYAMSSQMLHGVGRDARRIVEQL